MRLARVLCCCATLFCGTSLQAMTDLEAINLATNLGSVIGSEEFCSFSYNQAAIAEYVKKNVPSDRLDFAPMLQSAIMGAKYWQKDMTQSAKTAHCTVTKGTATQYGFME